MNHVLVQCQTIRKSGFRSIIMLVHVQNIYDIVLLLDILERRSLECFIFIARILLSGNFLLIYMTYFLFNLIERTVRLHHLSLFIFRDNEIRKLQTLSGCIDRIIQILWHCSSHRCIWSHILLKYHLWGTSEWIWIGNADVQWSLVVIRRYNTCLEVINCIISYCIDVSWQKLLQISSLITWYRRSATDASWSSNHFDPLY